MIITINGVTIHYEIYGEENSSFPTLLLLHGWMASIPAMAPIWQYFQRTRKVVVLDFPGQGGESGTLIEPWGIPEYSQMVKELMEQLQIKKPDVIGHSFGGRVIIYLASHYPELFHQIVLTDAAGLKAKFSFARWFRIKSFKMGKFLLKRVTKGEYQRRLKKLRAKYGSSDYASLTSDVMRQTFQKVVQLDLKENLKKIQNPCLLMWGEKDEVTPLYMARTMEKEIKDSGLVVLKDAGHFSYIDSAQEYNIIVEKFLGG